MKEKEWIQIGFKSLMSKVKLSDANDKAVVVGDDNTGFKSLMSKVKLQYFQYIYTTYFKKLQEILGNLIKKFVDIKISKISINTII